MQDLKAGHILGATPYKQQIMQVVGVVAGALVIAPVLSYLLEAYGMGAVTEDTPDALAAPQAALMQSVASGIFGGNLPWDMVSIGAIIGIIIIIIDQYLASKNANFRMPILAVAVGIYLPLELDTTIFIGGLIAWSIEKFYKKSAANNKDTHERGKDLSGKAGLLIASGLITGEALMGIFIAFLIVLGGADAIQVFDTPKFGSIPGLILFMGIILFLINIMKKVYKKESK
jgi:putative OPT family oligopeptide transporter